MMRAGSSDFRAVRCGASDYRVRNCADPLLFLYVGRIQVPVRSLAKHLNCGGSWGPEPSGYGYFSDSLMAWALGNSAECPRYHDPALTYDEQATLSRFTTAPNVLRQYRHPVDGTPSYFRYPNGGGWVPLRLRFDSTTLILTGQYEVSLVPGLYAQTPAATTVATCSCCLPLSYGTRTLAVEDYLCGFLPGGFNGPDPQPSESLIRSTIQRGFGTLDVQITIAGVSPEQWQSVWAYTSLPLEDGSGTDLRAVRSLLRNRSVTAEFALNTPQAVIARDRTLNPDTGETYRIMHAGYARSYTQVAQPPYDTGGQVLCGVCDPDLVFSGLSSGSSFGYHEHPNCSDGGTDWSYGDYSINAAGNFDTKLWLPFRQ